MVDLFNMQFLVACYKTGWKTVSMIHKVHLSIHRSHLLCLDFCVYFQSVEKVNFLGFLCCCFSIRYLCDLYKVHRSLQRLKGPPRVVPVVCKVISKGPHRQKLRDQVSSILTPLLIGTQHTNSYGP